MKKKYISPNSTLIELEGEVVIAASYDVNSGSKTDDAFSNHKDFGWDSSNWNESEVEE